MNPTPGQLKTIAESQGYESHVRNGFTYIKIPDEPSWWAARAYNPLENDCQLLELIKWLIERKSQTFESVVSYYDPKSLDYQDDRESFKHAVLRAVIEDLGL